MAEAIYDHNLHGLDSTMENATRWCGGTEPPTLVTVLDQKTIRVDLYPSGTDVHDVASAREPVSSTEETFDDGSEMDPYSISRAATRVARVAMGLSPEWKSNFANAREYFAAQNPDQS